MKHRCLIVNLPICPLDGTGDSIIKVVKAGTPVWTVRLNTMNEVVAAQPFTGHERRPQDEIYLGQFIELDITEPPDAGEPVAANSASTGRVVRDCVKSQWLLDYADRYDDRDLMDTIMSADATERDGEYAWNVLTDVQTLASRLTNDEPERLDLMSDSLRGIMDHVMTELRVIFLSL